MKNINVIALAVAAFTVGLSAADTTSSAPVTVSTTSNAVKPGFIGNMVSGLKNGASSVYAAVKNSAGEVGTYIQANKLKSALIGAAVVAAGVALWKNRTKIKNAIVNNPVKTAVAVLGAAALAYAYKTGYVKLPAFGNTVNVPATVKA